jgi:TonB family protein
MNRDRFKAVLRACRRSAPRLLLAAVLPLIVATTSVPVWAAEARAVKSRVAPLYPEIAKRMKITGVVKLEATVEADGKVSDVKTISGNHALSTAAEDAVRKWRFVPADSQSTVEVEINFAL